MEGLTRIEQIMVRMWANLIRLGRKTLDDVPEKLRSYVEELL